MLLTSRHRNMNHYNYKLFLSGGWGGYWCKSKRAYGWCIRVYSGAYGWNFSEHIDRVGPAIHIRKWKCGVNTQGKHPGFSICLSNQTHLVIVSITRPYVGETCKSSSIENVQGIYSCFGHLFHLLLPLRIVLCMKMS